MCLAPVIRECSLLLWCLAFIVLKCTSVSLRDFFGGVKGGEGYLHETLQLPWLGDKRLDYSPWHPLGLALPEYRPLEMWPRTSFFLPLHPLPRSWLCSLSRWERDVCASPESGLKDGGFLKVNTPLWSTSCESSRALRTLSFKSLHVQHFMKIIEVVPQAYKTLFKLTFLWVFSLLIVSNFLVNLSLTPHLCSLA